MKELKSALDLEPKSDGAKFAQALIDAKELGALPPPAKGAAGAKAAPAKK